MLSSGGNDKQARRMFSMAVRCRNKAFTTGVPWGTSGALQRYDKIESTLWKPENSSSSSTESALLKVMREQSSAKMTRSRMMGVARSESSHVLWITIVLWPPSMISEVYSSMALLLSPEKDVNKINIKRNFYKSLRHFSNILLIFSRILSILWILRNLLIFEKLEKPEILNIKIL